MLHVYLHGYLVTLPLHFNILLVFSLTIRSPRSLSSLFYYISSFPSHSLSLQAINPSAHLHNLAPPNNHHHHNITIHNNPTSKSTENQTHPHTNTQIYIYI